jgi:proline iminopeptidase
MSGSGPHWTRALLICWRQTAELSAEANLATWDRTAQLASIEVPTLVIGAQHDTMDPAHMKMMADRLPASTHLHRPNGSHMALYDDQQTYFTGLVDFLRNLRAPKD